MREIKFRMFSKKLSHMFYDQDNENESYLWDMKNNVTGGKIENDIDNIFMQYTGLKDKNNKEIYEGDIVKRQCVQCYFLHIVKFGEYQNSADFDSVDYLFGVGWYVEEYASYFDFRGELVISKHKKIEPLSHHGSNYKSPSPTGIEVIGNIYENPELLKKMK
ncbi:MAG: YopX family protein [Candidatus Pacearchaeota archaeon]|jgi:uncharacterized phage protein (TIGR01671 family)